MSPCCGVSLQTGAKIIAILHLVLSIIGVVVASGVLVLTTLGIFAVASSDGQNDHFHTKDESLGLIAAFGVGIFGIVFIAVGILFITLSALLLSGANKRNRTRCMIWFVVHAIFFVLSLVGTISAIFSERENGSAIAGGIFCDLINAYFLWVVWAFMSEIKEEGVEVEFQVPRVARTDHKTWA